MNCLTCIYCERPGAFEPCHTCLSIVGFPKYCPVEKPEKREPWRPPVIKLVDAALEKLGRKQK